MSDPIEIGKQLSDIVKDAIAPLRKKVAELEGREPIKGETGPQGEPGKDCEPIEITEVVRELVKSPDIMPILSMLVAEAVQKHMASNPVKDGKDGRDGEPGKDGKDGEQGIQGEKGVGAAGAMIDRDGQLIMTMTNGETIRLGNVVGKDGQNGKDGADL